MKDLGYARYWGIDQGEATFCVRIELAGAPHTDEGVAIAWSDDGLNGLQFDQWTSAPFLVN